MTLEEWRQRARLWADKRCLTAGGGPSHDAHEHSDERAPTHPLAIGVLGLSGVGKSSLLNALLTPGMQLLPAGGVGPLTAQPVRIVHRGTIELSAAYRQRAWLHEMLRGLQRGVLDDATLGQLSVLCTGEQYAARDPDWLLRALRYAINPTPSAQPECDERTLVALQRASAALDLSGGHVSVCRGDGAAAFHRAVREHVAGQLAPFCSTVALGCPSPLLAHGIDLIDLPGLGTSGDTHAKSALSALEQLSAVIIVVDRAGLADAVVSALVRSGFLGRWAAGDAAGVIAVTKLDLVADDARQADGQRASWREHLRLTMTAARDVLRNQSRRAFERAAGPVAGQLVSEAERIICPVSSQEMNALHADEGVRRVRMAESTGIPELRRAIVAMAREQTSPGAREITSALREARRNSPAAADLYAEWMALLDEETA